MRSGPYVPRMTRVSPPELARELPGPHASTRVTFAPRRRRCRAVHPPNAPAPTTMTFIGATRERAACAEKDSATETAGSIAMRDRREISGMAPYSRERGPGRLPLSRRSAHEAGRSERRPRVQTERPGRIGQETLAGQETALPVEPEQCRRVGHVGAVERDVQDMGTRGEAQVEDVVRRQERVEDKRVLGQRPPDRMRQRAREILKRDHAETRNVVADLRVARADVLPGAGQVARDLARHRL